MNQTTNNTKLSLRFLGTGSGGHLAMGSAAACLELNHQPNLLIDCGPGTLAAYHDHYVEYGSELPEAIFLTHCHMDHIADLEILTVRNKLRNAPPIKLFAPVSIIATLHSRLATYPGTMAEGGHNFWDSFQLIPVDHQFEHHDLSFKIYPTRHHAPSSSFALHLPGYFFYTGDTRPIPEILNHCCLSNEIIFHDCGGEPNPSHTGLSDLAENYTEQQRSRMVLYHYANESTQQQLKASGYMVASPGSTYAIRE